LKAAAERVHGEGERSAARRGVLLSLHAGGPQTVPQIANSRPVSRQHVQVVVNGLLEDHLVERVQNPAHRRSHLIRLTDAGRASVRQLLAREAAVFAELDLQASASDLAHAAEVLATLRQTFSPGAVDQAVRRARVG
jgi:DNA-binding MarR family transcriptional regulator